ncbi:MAG: TIGR00296 family protein [Thermoprotei archaeon]|nr:MAG: TIGR00296 family protein [Thermoprotei archaeon]
MFSLSEEEGALLVRIAREAVSKYLKERVIIEPPRGLPDKLYEKRGVFVTIKRYPSMELRGCIGYPEPILPLINATIRAALSSALEDPRFYPLSAEELEHVVFEVSVLTPPQLIKVSKPTDYPKQVKVGVDGLIVEKGIYRGLLLPQVAVEYGWSEEEFLSQCCIKAWLPPDAWLEPDTRIYKFQAEIFEEEHPGGEIKRKALS